MGLLLYYVKFSLVNKTFPINSLAIGQRDVNPSIQSVTIRGLEGQKYDSELNNPSNLLLGNLDFSFVLIYLFPLLIIAFTYNIVSEENPHFKPGCITYNYSFYCNFLVEYSIWQFTSHFLHNKYFVYSLLVCRLLFYGFASKRFEF